MSLTMFQTVLFLGVFAVAGAGGAAMSEQVFYGKPIHSEKTFLIGGRHMGRKRPSLKTIGEMRRSMDLGDLDLEPMLPTSGKSSFLTMVLLYPPTAKPLHLNANLPLRFGRRNESPMDGTLKSTPNLPQRFGRACAECPDVDNIAWPATTPQQRLSVINRPYRHPFRRSGVNLYWYESTDPVPKITTAGIQYNSHPSRVIVLNDHRGVVGTNNRPKDFEMTFRRKGQSNL